MLFQLFLKIFSEVSLYVFDPTGACHCQIMDCIVPGSVAMTKVKFDAQGEEDCKHNFSLLHEAFTKNGITRVCPFSGGIGLQCPFLFFCLIYTGE